MNSQAKLIAVDAGNDTIRSISELTDIFGGAGDDLILLEDVVWTNSSDAGNIYGGGGQDHLVIGEGGYALFAPDVLNGDTFGLRGVFGVETYSIVGSRTWIADHMGMDFSLGDDSDTINAYAAGHVHDLGDVNDAGGAFADNVTIIGGAGNDYLETDGNSDSFLYGGDGNDALYATCNSSLYGGAGDDEVRNWPSWADWSGDHLFASTDAGNDTVQLSGAHGEVFLGGGDDTLSAFGFDMTDSTDLIVETGSGRDVVAMSSDKASRIAVTDFDVALDRLQIFGVARLRDFDSYANAPEGVTLVLGNLTLFLEGVRAGDLDASVFLSF